MIRFLLQRSRMFIATAILKLSAPEERYVAKHMWTLRSFGAEESVERLVYKHVAPLEQKTNAWSIETSQNNVHFHIL